VGTALTCVRDRNELKPGDRGEKSRGEDRELGRSWVMRVLET